ncbi:hypothetical protein ACJQWK_08049 [Exserohilum turcicum]
MTMELLPGGLVASSSAHAHAHTGSHARTAENGRLPGRRGEWTRPDQALFPAWVLSRHRMAWHGIAQAAAAASHADAAQLVGHGGYETRNPITPVGGHMARWHRRVAAV